MGVGGDQQLRCVDTAILEALEFAEQHPGSTTTPLPITLVTRV